MAGTPIPVTADGERPYVFRASGLTIQLEALQIAFLRGRVFRPDMIALGQGRIEIQMPQMVREPGDVTHLLTGRNSKSNASRSIIMPMAFKSLVPAAN